MQVQVNIILPLYDSIKTIHTIRVDVHDEVMLKELKTIGKDVLEDFLRTNEPLKNSGIFFRAKVETF